MSPAYFRVTSFCHESFTLWLNNPNKNWVQGQYIPSFPLMELDWIRLIFKAWFRLPGLSTAWFLLSVNPVNSSPGLDQTGFGCLFKAFTITSAMSCPSGESHPGVKLFPWQQQIVDIGEAIFGFALNFNNLPCSDLAKPPPLVNLPKAEVTKGGGFKAPPGAMRRRSDADAPASRPGRGDCRPLTYFTSNL